MCGSEAAIARQIGDASPQGGQVRVVHALYAHQGNHLILEICKLPELLQLAQILLPLLHLLRVLPDEKLLRQYRHLELLRLVLRGARIALGCPGPQEAMAPVWSHRGRRSHTLLRVMVRGALLVETPLVRAGRPHRYHVCRSHRDAAFLLERRRRDCRLAPHRPVKRVLGLPRVVATARASLLRVRCSAEGGEEHVAEGRWRRPPRVL